jgi:hypothetical protein
MFHEGTLQSGITLAIQEKKLVACFVRSKSDCHIGMWRLTDKLVRRQRNEQSMGGRLAEERMGASLHA